MKKLPYKKLGFATIDTEREHRCGFPEVIFCASKTPQETAQIAREILRHSKCLLATRADAKTFKTVKIACKDAVYYAKAKIITVDRRHNKPSLKPGILIITAGTSDIPVAEEARITAEMLGHKAEVLYDVGVAGIHRVLAHNNLLKQARVLIVVAGMEGALASVVGGLVKRPVIAVPTSIGYGAHFGGITPLLGMLNSCAAGVSVVNIDNGFGAGYIASLINSLS
ncbi:MAG: nickel pincer cofactor biosynthesis protein LarB [Candidatus Brocadiia bacterium]